MTIIKFIASFALTYFFFLIYQYCLHEKNNGKNRINPYISNIISNHKLTMRLLTLTFCLLLTHCLLGQYSNIGYEKLEQTLNTKTYVVLFGDESFNEKLKQSISNYWTVTEYEFISIAEVDDYIKFEGYNMLLPLVKGGNELIYMYYILIPTGKKTVQSYNYNKLFAYMIVPSEERFEIRMDNIIQCMDRIIIINKEQNFEGKAIKMIKQYVNYYNQKAYLLKKGKLYLDKEYLENHIGTDRREVRTDYPYDFEIVNEKRIQELVENKEENAYYCVVDGSQTTVFEAATGNIVYCNVEMTPVFEITKNILKDIAETAKEKKSGVKSQEKSE